MKQQPFPKLIDNAGLQRELGIKRAAADAIMQHVPKVNLPGVSKTYVRREDVAKLLDESTHHVVTAAPLRRAV